jgi:hypothetical protein
LATVRQRCHPSDVGMALRSSKLPHLVGRMTFLVSVVAPIRDRDAAAGCGLAGTAARRTGPLAVQTVYVAAILLSAPGWRCRIASPHALTTRWLNAPASTAACAIRLSSGGTRRRASTRPCGADGGAFAVARLRG